MRPDGGGVQFFDLVEVDWRSDRDSVDTAVPSSGCTGGATAGMCTAAQPAGERGGGGRPGWRGSATGHPMRAGRITGITSGRAGRDTEPPSRAWGIMVPES
jgi:hypothetical protein